MEKTILPIFIFIIFMFLGCSTSTESSIEGTWHVTHVLGVPVSSGEYYYKFNSNETVWRDTDKSKLKTPVTDSYGNVITSQSPDGYGKYSISNGSLDVEFSGSSGTDFTVDAKYSGNTMYWYQNNIESIRLSKE